MPSSVRQQKPGNWLSRLLQRHSPAVPFSIPVLCYHSWTIFGPNYSQNDHVALASDLATLARRGYQVLPATDLVRLLRGELHSKTISGKKLVCLTCDDGKQYDYIDFASEEFGENPSFQKILEQSSTYLPQFSPGPKAVSFVIASPDDRTTLDRTCGTQSDEWGDAWWAESAAKNILGIANHSWDHVHDTLDNVRQRDNKKGSFLEIASFEDAEAQIKDAQNYIEAKCEGKNLPLFGYPYGHVPPYLRDEYLPAHAQRLGLQAAFSTAGSAVTNDSNVWAIPRLVCGEHWKTPEEFETLLDAAKTADSEQ